jgi:hypothetical protein
MFTVTQAETSNERKQLQSEVSLWRCEVSYLLQEYQKAVADLHRLEAALRQQAHALEAHAIALTTHEQCLAAEDVAGLAPNEPGVLAEGLTPLASVGSHEILKHWRHREGHEQIKRQHCAVLAYLALLRQTVSVRREGEDVSPEPRDRSRFHG